MSDPVFQFVATNPFGLTDVGSFARPIFVDIDGDSDLDAFIGDIAGNTLFFRNTGTTNNPVFAAAITNPFGLSTADGSPAIVDIDDDGDLDAFVGNVFFENTGTASAPAFAAPSSNPFGLVDVGYGTHPTFVDIDGDGDLDALIGNYDGNTLFFRNTGTASNPVFTAPSTNPFGLIDVGGNATPTFIDIDGDGDLDAFIGWEHYSGNGSTLFFRNLGSTSVPAFAAPTANPFGLSDAGNYTSPTFADIDGDGDADTLIGNLSGNTLFFQNTGIGSSPQFSFSSAFRLRDVGLHPDPTFVDIDGDGDLDAFVGTGYEYYYDAGGDILFFENTGSTRNPEFAARETNPFGLNNVGSFASPTFVDIDDDGDLDVFVGNSAGDTLFFENTGTASTPAFATAATNPFGLIGVGLSARTTFVDVDDDGDLDAFINNAFFENTGTASTPAFAAPQTNPFGLSGLSPTFADIDRDGDFDAFAGADGRQFFKNTGTASSPAFSFGGDNLFGLPASGGRSTVTSLTFVDIDGDGDFDAYVTENYYYAGIYDSQFFYINNNAPNVANLNAPETYAKNTPLNLMDIVVSDVDSANITAILTLSNIAAGSLNTATSGAVTSVYNAATGVWKASGALADVNILLADVTFTPAPDFNEAFSISTRVSDGAAPPLLGSKSFTTNSGVLLKSTPGDDILTGTASGNDTVSYASATAPVTVSLLTTTQQDTMGAGLDTLTKIEHLIGSKFNDVLTGNNKHNVLDGKAGNDILKGWSGADTMIGRGGHDTYFVENVGDVVIEELNQGMDTVSSKITYTLPDNVEHLVLTGKSAIDGTGNGKANNITGNKASNILTGGNNKDTLNGGAGADSLVGGPGNDRYVVDNVGDVITENSGEGTDTVSSKATFKLPSNVEHLKLTGSKAINGTGNELANKLTGNAADNVLTGGAGNDTLKGWSGADTMIGGPGRDRYFVENVDDVVIEKFNQGKDVISSKLTFMLPANVENLVLTGKLAIDGTGNGRSNLIIGNKANNELSGRNGNDTLDGKAGNNVLTGGKGKDVFKFTTKGHVDVITDYNVVDDTIKLDNAVFTAFTTTGKLAVDQFRIGNQALDANDFIIYNSVKGRLLYDADGDGAGAAVQIATVGVGLAMTHADIVVI